MHALQYGFEENKFLAAFMDAYGIWSLLFLKLLFILIVYYNYVSIKNANSKNMNLLWTLSKKGIAFTGLFLMINNIMVIWYDYSLLQLMGLV